MDRLRQQPTKALNVAAVSLKSKQLVNKIVKKLCDEKLETKEKKKMMGVLFRENIKRKKFHKIKGDSKEV